MNGYWTIQKEVPSCTDLKLKRNVTHKGLIYNRQMGGVSRAVRIAALTVRILTSYAEMYWSIATFIIMLGVSLMDGIRNEVRSEKS